MLVCGALLLVGLVLGVRWSKRSFEPPEQIADPTAGEVARRFGWYCSLVLLGGVGAGLCVIGGGGRLAMRLLAVTAGDAAQGRITEADETVGEITVDGTIGFIVFNGIFGGVVAGAIYLLLRRLLPPGWRGGLAFGAGLLVVLGATVDPLRSDNPDFDIVGPGWLAVLVFLAMALAFGVVLAGFMARLSTWLPLPSTERAVLMRYLLVAPVALVGFSITVLLVIVGSVVVVATRWKALGRFVRSSTGELIGRIAVLALTVAFLPNAIASAADIISR
jgi:hypothetical protein